MHDDNVRRVARRLRDLIEPLAGNVYFAPEAKEAYATLGFESSRAAYFASRGACMGQVPGEMVVAAFGVFNPDLVIPSVNHAWSITDAPTILAAREQGAVASLDHILGGVPDGSKEATDILKRGAEAATGEGRALFSGLRSLGFPGTPLGDLWRSADLLREHRGDSHIIAWVSHGLDAIQATLTTELWWRLPLTSYVKSRGWSPEQIDAAVERLRAAGLVDGDGFTNEGEALRAEIELCTDRQERSIVEAIGDDAERLFAILTPIKDAIVGAKGYPNDPANLTRP